MTITKLITYLPDELKTSIIDFKDVRNNGKTYIKVYFEKPFSGSEVENLSKNQHFAAVGNVKYKYAPEIRHGVIYVK